MGREQVRVSVDGTSRLIPNQIVTTTDTRGKRLLVAIGDVGDPAPGAREELAFDSPNLDVELAATFVEYWSWQHTNDLRGIDGWRAALSPMSVEITWPQWGTVPADRRRRFLRGIVQPRGTVVVNGRRAARWAVTRAILGLGPKIEPDT